MIINLNVKGQYIMREHYEVVADSVDYLYLNISFSSDWAAVTKTIMFKNGDIAVAVNAHQEDGTYKVPFEVIKIPYFIVSVRGDNDSLLITTDTVRIDVKASGLVNGQAPLTPTKDVYSEIMTEMRSTKQLVNQRFNNTDILINEKYDELNELIGDVNLILDTINGEVI